MNRNCVILFLFVTIASCALSSYLDIPPPPERPLRFKTKEQIENYLRAVKDYYDAFKIKLVRRDNFFSDFSNPQATMARDNEDSGDVGDSSLRDYQSFYHLKGLPENSYFQRRFRVQRSVKSV